MRSAFSSSVARGLPNSKSEIFIRLQIGGTE
jgi:hypothetical protein